MRKSWVALVFLLLAGINIVGAQNKKTAVHAIGFYNLENLFDTCHDVGHNDYEYLPSSKTPWNTEKYLSKLRHMSQALADLIIPWVHENRTGIHILKTYIEGIVTNV